MDKYKRVEATDPRRCQSNTAHGQCSLIAVEGRDVCVLHGGVPQNRVQVRNYRLQRWEQRVSEMADSDVIKSLREEIGILRMMLEERLNMITDVTELLTMSHAISDLVLKIERLVLSCHKIEKSTGRLIDRSEVINIAMQLMSVIEDQLADRPALVQTISDAFETICSTTGSDDDEL